MKKYLITSMAILIVGTSCSQKKGNAVSDAIFSGKEGEVKLITLDPGHFHAALVQKTSYPQVAKDVYVYAPEGDDVLEHLKKIDAYNSRSESPTGWNEIVYTGADFLQKMLEEKKGNVMVTAGNNGKKTEYIKQALAAGINVLADKPMAINTANFELLKECFEIARKNGVLLYDIMTERHEITTILQREFSLLPSVYGTQLAGTADDPAIVKESVHHFFKVVSGNPLKRPVWFFDVEQEGDGIVDVSTHLVDMIQWEAFPGVIIDYNKDIEMLDANRWSTPMSLAQFKEVTGADSYPDYLQKDVTGETLNVYANGDILYKIKGIYAKVLVKWNYTYPEGGGDTHFSVMKGSKSNLVIRQDKEQNYKPELFIETTGVSDKTAYEAELQRDVLALSEKYPGIGVVKIKDGIWQVQIPSEYRVGHEAHFGQVTESFLQYLKDGALPDWEVPNMITKYYITTKALEIAKNK